ncbi:hypothetical protein HPP92_016318 [Vanilla planifolia]|uniref:Uncharacterized protein n=1 Tax=Vanilla planifolia TaxID=51239 RepID=A0A835URY5_VANPL|nr:hypothetical protein HPP92_016318 [Vanilla planifolia]
MTVKIDPSNCCLNHSKGQSILAIKFHGAICVVDQALQRLRTWAVGISPQDLPFLFTKFAQNKAGSDKRHNGTGLGLKDLHENNKDSNGAFKQTTLKEQVHR